MKKLTILLLTCCFHWAIAQTSFTYEDYGFEENVDISTENLITEDFNYIYLKHNTVKEYLFEDEVFVLYDLVHTRIKILSEKGIEINNKKFISLYDDDVLVKQEARVLNEDGTIKEIKKDALKEAIDPETEVKQVYFAFEGISIGSVIDYYYIKKSIVKRTDIAINIQAFAPKYNVNYEIIMPSHLYLKTKSLNGLPEFQYDTTVTDRNKLYLKADYIEAFHDQESAFEGANMMYFLCKLDRNTSTGSSNMGSYAKASQNVYTAYHTFEKSDLKIIGKIIKKMDLPSDEEKKIRAVENYIKKNYVIIDNPAPVLADFGNIYDNKAMNETGALRLFVALFDQLGIKHQIVLTSDRTSLPFETDFEAYFFLNKSLLYFPKINKIMDPDSPLYRLGWTDAEYMNCYGLFIKGVSIGDYTTGIGEIKFIEPLPHELNYHSIDMTVDFTDGFEDAEYQVTNKSFGFKAYTQSLYDFVMDEEKVADLKKSAITYIDSEGDIEDLKVTNEGGSNFGEKPFITEARLVSNKFIENAGETVLFKLGELIGPQMELYQEEERTLPIQMMFNRTYLREIVFTIPDGYQIKNLDDINIKEEYIDEETGEVALAFYSSYKQEGNKVIVSSNEYYNVLEMPKEDFEAYQRVVNAAANFNKILLVIEAN